MDINNEQNMQPLEGFAQGAFLGGNCTITHRVGDAETIYSAPDADDVVWMAAQGEQQFETSAGPALTINIGGMQAFTGVQDDCAEEANSGLTAEERIRQLTAQRDAAFEQAKAEYENSTRYKGYLDRCGAAIGVEAFTSDDGSIQDRPHPSKIPELVEAMCALNAKPPVPVGYVMDARGGDRGFSWTEANKDFPRAVWERRPVFFADNIPAGIDRIVSGALFDFLASLTTKEKTLKLGAKHEAPIAIEALVDFANNRGLKLDEANVAAWTDKIIGAARTA